MLFHLLLSLILVLVTWLSTVKADTPPAYLLCANLALSTNDVVFYLQPLMSSTEHPADPSRPIKIDFDPNDSIMVLNTSTSSANLFYGTIVENDRVNMPLINTLEDPVADVHVLNTGTHDVKLISSTSWASDMPAAYVESLDQYWSVEVYNNFEPSQVVFNLYAGHFDDLHPNFTDHWDQGQMQNRVMVSFVSDSANQLLYTSLGVYPNNMSYVQTGELVTYDIQANKITHRVACDHKLKIRYSPSRKAMFAAVLAQDDTDGDYLTSIVEVDPTTCKQRTLIDNLGNVSGMILRDAFNDATGEWYFMWFSRWPKGTSPVSENDLFFSVNVHTKKATAWIGLTYDPKQTRIRGISTFQSSSDHDLYA